MNATSVSEVSSFGSALEVLVDMQSGRLAEQLRACLIEPRVDVAKQFASGENLEAAMLVTAALELFDAAQEVYFVDSSPAAANSCRILLELGTKALTGCGAEAWYRTALSDELARDNARTRMYGHVGEILQQAVARTDTDMLQFASSVLTALNQTFNIFEVEQSWLSQGVKAG